MLSSFSLNEKSYKTVIRYHRILTLIQLKIQGLSVIPRTLHVPFHKHTDIPSLICPLTLATSKVFFISINFPVHNIIPVVSYNRLNFGIDFFIQYNSIIIHPSCHIYIVSLPFFPTNISQQKYFTTCFTIYLLKGIWFASNSRLL